ncbi:MAG: hypothetical protein ACE5GD_06295 [Candidatus Geothermarchaeales archaeon]
MAEELRYIQREIQRVKRYLTKLENRVLKAQMKMESEEERINKLKEELRDEFPNMEFTREP